MTKKTTFCPMLLVAAEEMPPHEINKRFLDETIHHLDKCQEEKVKIEISKSVWREILNIFPWAAQGNAVLRQYVALWRKSIFTPLQKYATFREVLENQNARQNITFHCAITYHNNLGLSWADWIAVWKTGKQINGKHLNSIVGNEAICASIAQVQHVECRTHIFIQKESDWQAVIHPMYIKYPATLPCSGAHPFVPPDNWEQANFNLKGNQGGYLDKSGNEWQWRTHHGDHWDVQLSVGGYHRVSPEGNLL